MDKKKELAKNTLILTVGKVCTQFVSFLLLPLYTALLVPEEFGIVDLFNTYILLLVPLFNWQFESGLFRFMLDCRENKTRIKSLFSTVFLSNIIQVFFYLFLYSIFQKFIHSEFKCFLAIDVSLNILLNSLLQFSRGLGKNTVYSLASFLSAALTVIFNVLLIAVFRLGALGMFLATVIAKIITLVYLFFSTKSVDYISISSFDKKLLIQITKYSVPLIPNSLSWWIISASDRTIISFFLSVMANGIYTVANKFSSVYSTFFSIFNLSWTESASIHINDEDSDEFLTETINSMFLMFSSICFGIISFLPFCFKYLVNEKYSSAYYQVPFLMLAILFQVVMGLFSVIYVALKKSKELAKSTIGAAIINIGVNVIFIKYLGLYAASISTLVAFGSVAIYRYFDIRKYITVKLKTSIILSTLCVGAIATFSYYYNNFIINVLSLFIVIIYSIVANKSLLLSIYRTLINIAKKNKE